MNLSAATINVKFYFSMLLIQTDFNSKMDKKQN